MEHSNLVCLGGGHGLGRLLVSLRASGPRLTGIVATTDEGGSTGRLREEAETIAWGDLRNCLSQLCTLDGIGQRLFEYRFQTQGELDGHNLGNLVLFALDQLSVRPTDAIRIMRDMLNIKSHLLPMADSPTTLMAKTVVMPDQESNILVGELSIDSSDEDIDYLEFDSDDEDSDGIIDFIDECPNTPPGVEVDEKGCPLDTDKDFVPNFKDDELETRDGAPVTPTGVELTDEMIYLAYQKYMDSTGVFAETETKQIDGERRDKIKRKYKVQIGSFTDDGVDADLIDKFLSIPDVEIITYGDSLTVIAVGDYDNLPDAIKRKVKLTSEGFEAAIVVEKEKDGTLTSVGDAANNMATENNDHEIINSNGLIFRVQLGAFSKKQPKNKFNNANVMEIKGDDGLWKYLYTGSFESIEEAARKKIDLAIDFGVNDAFIVAYENGKRIKLKDAGVNTTANESDIKNTTTTYDKKAIKFKVQIGSYKNQLPIEVLSKFMEIEGVDQVSIENGLTRYTAGEFDTYQEAMKLKEEIIEKGIGGAFVIAQHKDELIPVNKAKELIAE